MTSGLLLSSLVPLSFFIIYPLFPFFLLQYAYTFFFFLLSVGYISNLLIFFYHCYPFSSFSLSLIFSSLVYIFFISVFYYLSFFCLSSFLFSPYFPSLHLPTNSIFLPSLNIFLASSSFPFLCLIYLSVPLPSFPASSPLFSSTFLLPFSQLYHGTKFVQYFPRYLYTCEKNVLIKNQLLQSLII